MLRPTLFLASLLGLGPGLSLGCSGTTFVSSTGDPTSTTGAGGTSSSSGTTAGTGGASTSSSSSSGSSSSGTTAGTGGASTSSSSSSSSGTTTTTGGGCGDCQGFDCCGATCVNLHNDIHNCGACGVTCPGPNPYCDQGLCGQPPCAPGQECKEGALCCGASCCAQGDLCCMVPGPVAVEFPACTPPTVSGTCPMGCVLCACASPDTPIATPFGDRPIAELAVGDLVYSVSGQAVVAVPLLRVNKVAVRDHGMVRVSLESGAVLEISPKHPTADGRTFADLRPGERLAGVRILGVERIPYTHPFTHDILPASSTGAYFAGGALVGSTLFGPVDVELGR